MYTFKIALVGKEELFLKLLQNFLNKQSCVQCLFTAKSEEDFKNKIIDHQELPNVVIIELQMHPKDGAKIAQWLNKKYPKMRCIVISSQYNTALTGYILKSGANAFLPKEISPEHLLEVINVVNDKGFYWQQEQIETLRTQIKSEVPKPNVISNTLTGRETEVLQLLCQEFTAREIAEKLFVSKRTVEGHKENLFAKTGARNLAGLVFYALQQGLVNNENVPML
ncbi:hypothetical protein BKI52_19235 [marine bacterium AO1-C]|nr:hypothetical protein BKI52_19235 [marine bacterium AO1-C]